MRLAGKGVWVIGASSGIGAATARECLARGARVAISARREDRLRDVSEGQMAVFPLDVTDAAAVEDAAGRVRAELAAIDVALIAAGYWKQMRPKSWDVAAFDRQVRVNLLGTGNAIAAVLPQMLRDGGGVIAGVASVAGYRGLPGAEAYGATKAAQINLLEALRAHVRGSGVRVTTICPGFVRTELTQANGFRMPFMIEPEQAARQICAGLERERAEIVFPLPMAALMKAARLVPVSVWSAVVGRSTAA